jgi:hypothetical protein
LGHGNGILSECGGHIKDLRKAGEKQAERKANRAFRLLSISLIKNALSMVAGSLSAPKTT